ncbi:hypothetical protein [Granulicella tundricola]|nr:hypothetical protein [Granulicella tundricola]
MPTHLDAIYLNKHEDRPESVETVMLEGQPMEVLINDWTYYRVRGGEHTGESSVQICRVTFPKFEDDGTVIDLPFRVGKTGVPEELDTITQEQWGLLHSQSIHIGFIG